MLPAEVMSLTKSEFRTNRTHFPNSQGIPCLIPRRNLIGTHDNFLEHRPSKARRIKTIVLRYSLEILQLELAGCAAEVMVLRRHRHGRADGRAGSSRACWNTLPRRVWQILWWCGRSGGRGARACGRGYRRRRGDKKRVCCQ